MIRKIICAIGVILQIFQLSAQTDVTEHSAQTNLTEYSAQTNLIEYSAQTTLTDYSAESNLTEYTMHSNLTETNSTYVDDEIISLNDTLSVENLTDFTVLLSSTTTSYMAEVDETISKEPNLTYNQSQITTPVPDTSMLTTLAPPLKEEIKPNECACDLLKRECDINCCCDVDCSDTDKSLFDSCYIDKDYDQHHGLCYSTVFLYKNNTAYKVLREEKGLFCIAQDNLPERLHYTNQKLVSSSSAFNKIWNRKKQFNWTPTISNEDYKFSNNTYYKYGAPIWKYNAITSSLSNINIPISIYSRECGSFRVIKYLENFESNCLYHLSSSNESCSNNTALNASSFKNITLISNPNHINTSNLETIPDDYLVPVQTVLCEENNDCVETQILPEPSRDDTSMLCQNVVKSANIVIKHNGSAGIIDAQFIIKLANVSVIDGIMQQFKVTFEWAKNESITFKRSGAPGYIYSKPLICGNLITIKVGDKSEQIVHISNEGKQWLTIPKASNNGFCEKRMPVLFNDNVLSQCSVLLDLENTCEKLHMMVWDTLFNDYKINITNPHQFDVLISSHGNPNPRNLKEWVPIFFEDFSDYDIKRPSCPSLISGVRYHILYSYYGSISKPQAKIIGILVKTQISTISCANRKQCPFKLSTSITYTDVSQKAESKFAKPPIIRIRLPSDFFYPFSSKASNSNKDFIIAVIYVFLLVVIF